MAVLCPARASKRASSVGGGNMELIDIGVNLTHRSFAGDLEAVIERARAAGVFRQILTGTSVEGIEAALALAGRFAGELFATAGVHPHHARDWDEDAARRIAALARDPRVVALGECGLDYDRDFSPRPAQRRAFEAQLELAVEHELPVFLHERSAHGDFTAILAEYRKRLRGAVVHCFTGGVAELRRYLELDCHIGVTGWVCDERRGDELRAAVPEIPADRLMLETDAPFLLPRTIRPRPRSRRNEPALLPWVLEEVAKLRGEPPARIAAQTTHNAQRFFDR